MRAAFSALFSMFITIFNIITSSATKAETMINNTLDMGVSITNVGKQNVEAFEASELARLKLEANKASKPVRAPRKPRKPASTSE